MALSDDALGHPKFVGVGFACGWHCRVKTREIKRWKNNRETPIESNSDEVACYCCCMARTGAHVIYT
jgi:hypothetical protein